MSVSESSEWPGRLAERWGDVRRSFTDFLAVPAGTVLVFVLLAIATNLLDRGTLYWLQPLRHFLTRRLITDARTTTTLLATIAGAVITVTSITFSLLLLAVQQSATAFTNQILDQFLNRRLNQVYFGIFVGVSVFALLTLATNDTRVTPVFGATAALLMTLGALFLLVMLLYTTLNQMRPERIIAAIHDQTISARKHQRQMLQNTRRHPLMQPASATLRLHAQTNGFVAGLDLELINKVLARTADTSEVMFCVALGDYVCRGDVIAEIRSGGPATRGEQVLRATESAVSIQRQRNFRRDPGLGISQITTMGWTAISSAKSNPHAGMAAIRALRDLLVRFVGEKAAGDKSSHPSVPLRIVYNQDPCEEIIDSLESLAIVSSESLQHQSAAQIISTFAATLSSLPVRLRSHAESAVLRILSSLGDHVLATDLDASLTQLTQALQSQGCNDTADAVDRAHRRLEATVGKLGSRGTRAR